MVNRQTIMGKIFHSILIGVLLFALGAVVFSPQPVSAFPPHQYAISFDGIDDYVDCGNDTSFDITEAITIELWVNADSWEPLTIPIFKSGAYYIGVDNLTRSGVVKPLVFYCYGVGYYLSYASANFDTGTWYHIVATYDRQYMRMYVNGSEVVNKDETAAIATSTQPLVLGALYYDPIPTIDRYFDGTIDEVRVYNRAITPEEVAYNYDGGDGRATPYSTEGLAGWWHMNEGSGGTIHDKTANGNDGTIYGASWVAGFPFPVEPEKIEFTTPPRTVVAYRASEAMTIQVQGEFGDPAPVTTNTTIALGSSLIFDGKFSLLPDPFWIDISSVIITAGTSEATFYYKAECDYIGDATIHAFEDPNVGWTDAIQVVTVQGPVQLWRGPFDLIGTYFAIQEAIDDAIDGDDIIALPGIYQEQIKIDKQVTVKSQDGAASTIIDAEFGKALAWQDAIYPAVWIQRDGVVLGDVNKGFTIRNTYPMVFPEGGEDPSEYGMAILANAPECTIEGNTIADSNPAGIFADGDTTISGNTIKASIMGIYFGGDGGGGGGTITDNIVSGSMYCGIYSESPGSIISGNTVSDNSWYAILVRENDNQIIDNDLYDNQGAAITLQHTSNADVVGNYISTFESVAGIYGIDVQGGKNNLLLGNEIEYVLVGGISLNNTCENNLSSNDIYDIYGYDLWGGDGGDARWTREQAKFDRFSVKLETGTGEDPLGIARLQIPTAFPFERFGMGGELGGELYFWAYLKDTTFPLPTYQLELDNGHTLEANTGCPEGLWPNQWLKLSAMGPWTDVDTHESKSFFDWITQYSDARVVSISVFYSGASNKTMYIDSSEQEGMPMEPPKGIVIARSDRNSVSDNGVYCVNGAGILIVESRQNMLGNGNEIVDNGVGIVIENSNDNTVKGSLIADNYQEGVLVTHSYNNQIIGNDIIFNPGEMSGVHLDGESCNNEIHANNIVYNTDWDEDDNIISFGVFKEGGCWVNATGNWWGDASGPSGVGPGNGDAVSDFVNFEPWANTPLPEGIEPTIAEGGSLAMPRMTALLGMFMGDVGPEWTSLVVEAWDNEGGVGIAQVTVNLLELSMQMLPEEPEIPDEKQDEWDKWLSQLEKWELRHCDDSVYEGVYQRHFNLDELLKPLAGYLGEDDTQRIIDKLLLGEFFIPVTVTDWCGNEATGNIELTIVDIIQPLKQGWNLVSTPVTLDEDYTYLGDICDLGGGFIYDVLVVGLWYDSEFQDWAVALMEDEVKPLTALCVYVDGNTQIGLIFDRYGTAPPKLELSYDWNLVSLAIPPTDWDSMPVNKAMGSVEEGWEGYRGYTVVVSPYQQVKYNEEYCYHQDTEDRDYCFGGYDWHFEQEDWGYAVVSDDIPEMSIGGGYWVFMQEEGMLAGFGTTPVTRVFRDEPGHDLDLVPRYNEERVTRTYYNEYRDEGGGYTKIFLTYSGDVNPGKVSNFYEERMPEYGWNLTAPPERLEDTASLDFTMEIGDADFSCHIAIVGGESIKIRYESQEPGVDLPDVPRFEWDPVVMTAYGQGTDFTGTDTQTNISYEGKLEPEEVYKFYQERMHEYGWEYIGEECHHEFAWLMFRRNDEENRTHICLIWAERGLIEIEHHQYAASVSPEYIDDFVIPSLREKVEMRKREMQPPPEEPEP